MKCHRRYDETSITKAPEVYHQPAPTSLFMPTREIPNNSLTVTQLNDPPVHET